VVSILAIVFFAAGGPRTAYPILTIAIWSDTMADPEISRLFLRIKRRRPISDTDRIALGESFERAFTLEEGKDVVLEGSRPTRSTLLLSGFAIRYGMLGDGKRQITAIHVPGDFVDLHSYPLEIMDHTVAALSDCRFTMIPHASLERLVQGSIDLGKTLWMLTLLDAAIHREWLAAMGGLSALARTAHLFCELLVRLRVVGLARERAYDFPINQKDLADVLGLSPVHMNRTLQDLRAQKLIEFQHHEVAIFDWSRLCNLAQFDPKYLHLRGDESF
jgi:CRP-like cAMP-binding protein